MTFDELSTTEKDALHKLTQKEPYEGDVPGFDLLVLRGLASTANGWTQLTADGRSMVRDSQFLDWRKRRYFQR